MSPAVLNLAPAKPYAGKAQTASVAAAVRKMIARGWAVQPSHWPDGYVQLSVRGGGTLTVDDVLCPAATLFYRPDAIGVSVDEVRAALSAAGWKLSDSRYAGHWLAMEVTGPGVEVWAAARKAQRAADEAADAEERAEVAVRAARLNALTAGHALRAEIGFVEADDATVTLSTATLIELLEALFDRS